MEAQNNVNNTEQVNKRHTRNTIGQFLRILLGVLVIALICTVVMELGKKEGQSGGFFSAPEIINLGLDNPSEIYLSAINTIGIN